MYKKILVVFILFVAISYGQRQDKVDFLAGNFSIHPSPMKKEIEGKVIYTFRIIEQLDSIFLDAKNISFSKVALNKKEADYLNTGRRLIVKNNFKAGQEYSLEIYYKVQPKQTVYFLGWEDEDPTNNQIWTQGQGKYTSHWLPSFDDMNEKVIFDFVILTDLSYPVIANGKRLEVVTVHDDMLAWRYQMKKPMSSYLLAFAIGDYRVEKLNSKSGIPIELWYNPMDSSKVEPTYRYSKQIFDFLEIEIGVPYPWQNYKQIPVRDFLYAGMENTGATIFSDAYVIDSVSFVDQNYVNINAHELAHQWFGNLVTEVDSKHHWLHEGFATYYAYLAEAAIFGEDHFYWKLYQSAKQLEQLSMEGKGERLTDPKASSLTFYEKGAIALFMLREQIGDKAFKEGVQQYLKKHQFENVQVQDFLQEVEKASGQNLAFFNDTWLKQKEFPIQAVMDKLKEASVSLRLRFEMYEDLKAAQSDDINYKKYWDASNSVPLKAAMIEEFHDVLSETLIEEAFASEEVKIRQALAQTLSPVPPSFKSKYEGLLDDQSYITVEHALFNLWQSFPENRIAYLDRTKNMVGLNTKNIRLMWLVLAIITEAYKTEEKAVFFKELTSYTHPKYPLEVRRNAFRWIGEVFSFTDQNLLDLINASQHHQWQFKKYSRNLLQELMKNDDYKSRIGVLKEKLGPNEIRYIETILDTE